MTTIRRSEWLWFALIAASTMVAWLGLFIHNISDLPGQNALSPESFYPGVFSAALLALWLVPSARRIATWALLVWAAVSLVGGGILSILPIGLFPFVPDQSLRHYTFHAIYSVSQLPLIWVCLLYTSPSPRD